MISVEIALLIAVAGALWTVAAIGIGFRMGRKVAGHYVEPIMAPKSEPPMIEEDPYFLPMMGYPQSRIPTVDAGGAQK